jgi:hypothetical protein
MLTGEDNSELLRKEQVPCAAVFLVRILSWLRTTQKQRLGAAQWGNAEFLRPLPEGLAAVPY